MYKNYFNIDYLKKDHYKKYHIFDNNKKLYAYELFTKKDIEYKKISNSLKDELTNIRYDVVSYGDYTGSFITNYNTLKFLALNPDENLIEKKVYDVKDNVITNTKTFLASLCFVENKTKFYKLFFDFDYKYDKYPEIYAGFMDLHETITDYILIKIIESLNDTLNLSKSELNYVWACKNKSIGYHVYFPNIIVDRQLHLWILIKSIEKIKNDKIYPMILINKIFDDSVCKSNGLRLFYYKYNDDFYYPLQTKSTFTFDSEPSKHFHLCILNTDYDFYNFNLKIHMDLIYKNNNVIETKIKDGIVTENITDFKTINTDDKKSLIVSLANILNIDRIDNYSNWISLIYMFKNFDMYQEIIDLSKKSTKFDDNSIKCIDKIFKNKTMRRDSKPITLGSLIDWAKSDNIEMTNKIFAKYFLSLKLDINTIEDIVQSRFKINTDFIENSKYISDNVVDFFKNKINNNVDDKLAFVIQSGTGTGKTTAINKLNDFLLKSNPNYTILSIVTRRSMCACHITAFTSKTCVFNSYLDESYDTLDYFISSLENLTRISDTYDIIILDEINSLINYFYSNTLEHKRANCISILLKLLNKSKIILACDANITDLVFSFFNQIKIKFLYYKNSFMNKQDIPLNIYYSQIYNYDLALYSFCDEFIKNDIINNKSVLIFTDSKTITDNIKDYLFKFNQNHDYFRVYNKDEGTLKDLIDINNIGINRAIIANSKILYGIDIKIPYDKIFVIYKSVCSDGLDSFCMIQQMNRARDTNSINMLVLDPRANYYFNTFISYDENKILQQKYINGYSIYHADLCKKYNSVNEFGCTNLNSNGIVEFSPNSIMTEIHFIKSWYDSLFNNNKIDVVKLIADKSYGYKINIFKWKPDDNVYLFDKKNIKKNEIVNINKQIYLGKVDDIDEKYKFCIDNLKEQITLREKYLHNIDDPNLYVKLACNEKLFVQYINKKFLDLSKEDFDKKIIDINNNDVFAVIKSNDMINKINSIFWIEQTLNFKRYSINDIKCTNFDDIISTFNKNIDKFYPIFKTNESKKKTLEHIKNKFSSINNLNLLQKFIADCYNHISYDTIKINYIRQNIDINNKNNYYEFIY